MPPPPEHAPAAAAHAAAERLKAKPDHKPDGGRPQGPKAAAKSPPAKKTPPPLPRRFRQTRGEAAAPQNTEPLAAAGALKVLLDPPPRPPATAVLGDGTALRRADAPETYDAIDDSTGGPKARPATVAPE